MTTLEKFEQHPMKIPSKAYRDSFFHLYRAPENATGEVIIASLYRKIGFNISEREVTEAGEDLLNSIDSEDATSLSSIGITIGEWKYLLKEILKSPKQPGQPKKTFLQLTPIVPDAALYSLAARFKGNPWNPGELVKSIIRYGCKDNEHFKDVWGSLHEALSVNGNDDIWARYLDQEFKKWRNHKYTWEKDLNDSINGLTRDEWQKYDIPAKRFVKDLQSIIILKPTLTRRQWVSMVETLVRIATASHVLWICDVNWRIWLLFQRCLNGETISFEVASKSIMPDELVFCRYGERAVSLFRRKAREYITARIGINYTMFLLEKEMNDGNIANYDSQLNTVEDVHNICTILLDNKDFLSRDINHETTRLLEKYPKILSCKAGITKNMLEFLRYSLGQRQTLNPEDRSYDQGYWLLKNGRHKQAPWIFSAGPIALITLSYCCTKGSLAPRTIDEFRAHLSEYGILVKPYDLINSGLGKSLRELGIVIDSPDAEGGMVLLNPFRKVVDSS